MTIKPSKTANSKGKPQIKSVKKDETKQFIDKKDVFEQVERTLPEEARAGFKEIRKSLEEFQKNLFKEKHDHIKGLALLPPSKIKDDKGVETVDKNIINVLVLLDDTPLETTASFYQNEPKRIEVIAKKTSDRLSAKIVFVNQLWTEFSDAKYDLAIDISMSLPFYDTGYLSAVKIGEVHKSMVIKKFEKYIVSYVLAGSLIQGRATEKSDIDVFIVIDDTDVKRMSRTELKDKLRAIIIGMGIEAGEMTGIKNKLHVQVYILTDFWHSIREANPVIFTFLRDGVPLYDRGIYTPWKLLLKQGRIKPSQEAIDLYMNSGRQVIQRAKLKLREIGMEDTYYALLTPSQAALMLYGLTPATAKETAELMRKIFVKEEKILEEKYVKILEDNIKIRKELEHGDRKELSGKEIDTLIVDTEKFLERIEKLFEEIDKRKSSESIEQLALEIETAIETAVKIKSKDKNIKDVKKRFAELFIKENIINKDSLKQFEKLVEAKNNYSKGKLKRTELEIARREGTLLLRTLVELNQRLELKEQDSFRLRIVGADGTEFYSVNSKIYAVQKNTGEVKVFGLNDKSKLNAPKKASIEDMNSEMKKSTASKLTIDSEIINGLEKAIGQKIVLIQ